MDLTPGGFLGIVQGAAQQGAGGNPWALASIDAGYSGGQPRLKFDGETSTSTRTYPVLGGYTPVAGDRVLVALVRNGAIVLGRFA